MYHTEKKPIKIPFPLDAAFHLNQCLGKIWSKESYKQTPSKLPAE